MSALSRRMAPHDLEDASVKIIVGSTFGSTLKPPLIVGSTFGVSLNYLIKTGVAMLPLDRTRFIVPVQQRCI
jgi:hypothetical protein